MPINPKSDRAISNWNKIIIWRHLSNIIITLGLQKTIFDISPIIFPHDIHHMLSQVFLRSECFLTFSTGIKLDLYIYIEQFVMSVEVWLVCNKWIKMHQSRYSKHIILTHIFSSPFLFFHLLWNFFTHFEISD